MNNKQLAALSAAILFPAVAMAESATPEPGQGTRSSAFNPAISVILDAGYYHENKDEPWHEAIGELPGFAFSHAHDDGHDHGHGPEDGFNLFHAEVMFSASVDNLFDAALNLGVDEDGIEIEEAYGMTRNLPAGLQLKLGKFYSGIGYLNSQHAHAWDFADLALPYRLMFGDHGLNEKGVQLTWNPATTHYSLFGLEVLQGENALLANQEQGDDFDHGSASRVTGPRMLTAFAKFGPDLGHDHALQMGVFGGRSRINRVLDEHGGDEELYEGKPWFVGTDWVYKHDAGGYQGQGSLSLQAEYIYRVFDRKLVAGPDADELGERVKDTQDALYVQGVYGIAPRWRTGLRYEVAGITNKHEHDGHAEDSGRSTRVTANLTWQPSEFSKLRLQASQGSLALEDGRDDFRQVYLQYQLSLGAHGAHRF